MFDKPRSLRLRELFSRILSGEQYIATVEYELFLEAICDQNDPAACIQKLVGSDFGLDALQVCLRADTSPDFFNKTFQRVLRYLQSPELGNIYGGEVLKQVVSAIIDPPDTLDAFVEAIRSKDVTEDGLAGFSWLLLQIVSMPIDTAIQYAYLVEDPAIFGRLLESKRPDTCARAYRIGKIARKFKKLDEEGESGPGGRHDNDFAEIHKISILPSPDELASRDPFLRRAEDVYGHNSHKLDLALHTDNQFRLLREDMLRDLREEIENTLYGTGRSQRGLFLEYLSMTGVVCNERESWSLQLSCLRDLPQLRGRTPEARKAYIKEKQGFLKHQSVACILVDQEIVTIAMIIREEDLLAVNPPIICLQIAQAGLADALPKLKKASNITVVQLSTAVFAYEPVLRQLQEIKELPLEQEILHWKHGEELQAPEYEMSDILLRMMDNLEKNHSINLQHILDLPISTHLDESQAACFLTGLRQRLSLIQGPPGTGKSFIGSLIAKAIYAYSQETILVVCYTHHALDQFLEDLLDTGIPESEIIRLGSPAKATPRTYPLSLVEKRQSVKLSSVVWQQLKIRKDQVKGERQALRDAYDGFIGANVDKAEILEYLEVNPAGFPYFGAFLVPGIRKSAVKIGKKTKTTDIFYLLDRWCRGKDPGIFKNSILSNFREIWTMEFEGRMQLLHSWRSDILRDRTALIGEAGKTYNASLNLIKAVHMEKDRRVIQGRRIIGCTTTAAAKYARIIQSLSPGVLLVEEAGEILESHILTAIGPDTKQLIMIGDHKQLRPRSHYDLSVEKGDGYDLNRSLFERLVLKEYPHQVLHQQHRMRPEISDLVRQLTYPNLIDAPSTRGRPCIKGFRDNLVFVKHSEHETEPKEDPDDNDVSSPTSRQNSFEAKMTLKCVRYLAQQGYGTENMVVLTPYLGQLRLLADELGEENDPVLNDLDCHALIRAGLMPRPSPDAAKPQIRISTIDNFQGEEKDIAIISLTRSNERNNIGFLSSPERLNVLLSRARDALIMIGNADTFRECRHENWLWDRFITMLEKGGHMYDGFPVVCERHLDTHALLCRPEDFDEHCPDGGCTEYCDEKLSCGIHDCPQYCHHLSDHSKMPCEQVSQTSCEKGHEVFRRCNDESPFSCETCVNESSTQQAKPSELELQIKSVEEQISQRQKAEGKTKKPWKQKNKGGNAARRGPKKSKKPFFPKAEPETALSSTIQNEMTSITLVEHVPENYFVVQKDDLPEKDLELAKGVGRLNLDKFGVPEPISGNDYSREYVLRWLESDCHVPPPPTGRKPKKKSEKVAKKVCTKQRNSPLVKRDSEDINAKMRSIKATAKEIRRRNIDKKNERLGLVLIRSSNYANLTAINLLAGFLSQNLATPASVTLLQAQLNGTGSGILTNSTFTLNKDHVYRMFTDLLTSSNQAQAQNGENSSAENPASTKLITDTSSSTALSISGSGAMSALWKFMLQLQFGGSQMEAASRLINEGLKPTRLAIEYPHDLAYAG